MKLHCFSENTVTYQTADGTYVHAGYTLTENALTFNGIEELVIDEATERKASLQTVLRPGGLVAPKGDEAKANSLFNEYMSMPVIRRGMMERGQETPRRSSARRRATRRTRRRASRSARRRTTRRGFPFGKKGRRRARSSPGSS
jgi:hypothetical protein